ncbi:MAG: transporter [Verrucomicrobia bacterium]|nr:transporter [Verrucomicrobiota bacterium]
MKTTVLITSLLAVAVSVWLVPSALAAEKEHEHEGGKMKIPDTAAGILKEVKEHEEELGKIITDKKLNKVHEVAFEIRDLVNALPNKSKDLPADKLSKVKANAKFVASLADRLDKSGDANDQAGTETNFKKLQDLLKQIRALYPDSASKSSAAATVQYTCKMDKEVVQDRPGNCPKCDMKLIAKS